MAAKPGRMAHDKKAGALARYDELKSVARVAVEFDVAPSTIYRWRRERRWSRIAQLYPDSLDHAATLEALQKAGCKDKAAHTLLDRRAPQRDLFAEPPPVVLDNPRDRAREAHRLRSEENLTHAQIARRLSVCTATIGRYLKQPKPD